jgi:hypothetical protein
MPSSLARQRAVRAVAASALTGLPALVWATLGLAQETLPWARDQRAPPRYEEGGGASSPPARPNDAYSPRYAPPPSGGPRPADTYQGGTYGQPGMGPPPTAEPYPSYASPPSQGYGQSYAGPAAPGYGQPYTPGPSGYEDPSERGYGSPGPYEGRSGGYDDGPPNTYSSREILATGHSFFGSVSKGLASVVEYAFQNQGRPNGYILGQEASGAFVAGLRYGEGILYTRDAGTHRVYWQGPSIGYDAGAEGSKVMILIYNLRDPGDIYQRFGGVDGSAYFVGGVGITFQKSRDIVVAPIRSGVGLRLGANVGYLKYTPRPTWNPF